MTVDASQLRGIEEEQPWTMFTVIALGGPDRNQPVTCFTLAPSAGRAAWIVQRGGNDVVAVIPGTIDTPLSPERLGVLDPIWLND
jgi:hypothetical protein